MLRLGMVGRTRTADLPLCFSFNCKASAAVRGRKEEWGGEGERMLGSSLSRAQLERGGERAALRKWLILSKISAVTVPSLLVCVRA